MLTKDEIKAQAQANVQKAIGELKGTNPEIMAAYQRKCFDNLTVKLSQPELLNVFIRMRDK